MGEIQKSRRNAHFRYFQNREYWHRSFKLHGAGDLAPGSPVSEYLAAANFQVTGFSGTQATRMQVAQLADITIAHAHAPSGTALWPRDEISRHRAALVLSPNGDVSVSGAGVLTRSPGIALIPPGISEVEFALEQSSNELVFIGMSASLIADIPLPSTTDGEPIDAGVVDGAFRMLTALAQSARREPTGPPLRHAVAEMTRSIVHLMRQGSPLSQPLFDRATEAILLDISNSKLSADTLAPRLGVSARSLQLEFQRHGTTVQRHVRGLRGAAATRMRRENVEIDATTLAQTFGFGSKSALYRALAETAGGAASSP
ncbi:helix-turn-helix domain-containing protein [Leucobacter sp. gxy201]|uniref:helix-turn-helix domain-containing protein n=1 Tax=Leucobacter sp. gxy201 TaxID=2957200 RepID=UPI003DA1BE04